MIVASFLVKDLHVEWQHGARHFMQWLVDGDLASNQHGWQWTAGCGTDAAPYFRVFNPITQGGSSTPRATTSGRGCPSCATPTTPTSPSTRSSTTRRSAARRWTGTRGSSDERPPRPGQVLRAAGLRQRRLDLRRDGRARARPPGRPRRAVAGHLRHPAPPAAARHLRAHDRDRRRDRRRPTTAAPSPRRERAEQALAEVEAVDADDGARGRGVVRRLGHPPVHRPASRAVPTARRATGCGSSPARSTTSTARPASPPCGPRTRAPRRTGTPTRTTTGGPRSPSPGPPSTAPAAGPPTSPNNPAVLGRMTARVDTLPVVGEEHVRRRPLPRPRGPQDPHRLHPVRLRRPGRRHRRARLDHRRPAPPSADRPSDRSAVRMRLASLGTQTNRCQDGARAFERSNTAPWWRDAVVYQVYVRCFADSDGDGLGDLPASPSGCRTCATSASTRCGSRRSTRSPQHDAGYDVSDYVDVDPRFGTLADADALLAKRPRPRPQGRRRPGAQPHLDEHEWFQKALAAGPGSPERERYVFREGKGRGRKQPPNNWGSVFGGDRAGETAPTTASGTCTSSTAPSPT